MLDDRMTFEGLVLRERDGRQYTCAADGTRHGDSCAQKMRIGDAFLHLSYVKFASRTGEEMSHMDRRRFNSILAGLGLATAGSAFGRSGSAGEPEILRLSRNGWMPNNEHLPVLLYRNVITASGADPAAHFEAIFVQNGWP